jgi:hypothetical protein
MEIDYKQKYLKYKSKYLELQKMIGGVDVDVNVNYDGKNCHELNPTKIVNNKPETIDCYETKLGNPKLGSERYKVFEKLQETKYGDFSDQQAFEIINILYEKAKKAEVEKKEFDDLFKHIDENKPPYNLSYISHKKLYNLIILKKNKVFEKLQETKYGGFSKEQAYEIIIRLYGISTTNKVKLVKSNQIDNLFKQIDENKTPSKSLYLSDAQLYNLIILKKNYEIDFENAFKASISLTQTKRGTGPQAGFGSVIKERYYLSPNITDPTYNVNKNQNNILNNYVMLIKIHGYSLEDAFNYVRKNKLNKETVGKNIDGSDSIGDIGNNIRLEKIHGFTKKQILEVDETTYASKVGIKPDGSDSNNKFMKILRLINIHKFSIEEAIKIIKSSRNTDDKVGIKPDGSDSKGIYKSFIEEENKKKQQK